MNKRLLLELTVQLTEQMKDNIKVYEGDSPDFLANEFCLKHNLRSEAQPIIANNIRENIKSLQIS